METDPIPETPEEVLERAHACMDELWKFRQLERDFLVQKYNVEDLRSDPRVSRDRSLRTMEKNVMKCMRDCKVAQTLLTANIEKWKQDPRYKEVLKDIDTAYEPNFDPIDLKTIEEGLDFGE